MALFDFLHRQLPYSRIAHAADEMGQRVPGDSIKVTQYRVADVLPSDSLHIIVEKAKQVERPLVVIDLFDQPGTLLRQTARR
jgi:hypothetical protein